MSAHQIPESGQRLALLPHSRGGELLPCEGEVESPQSLDQRQGSRTVATQSVSGDFLLLGYQRVLQAGVDAVLGVRRER